MAKVAKGKQQAGTTDGTDGTDLGSQKRFDMREWS
jgi:hypothetical protein